ncbi:MAG: hypothetical protein ACTS6P_01175 [Candidatus Hodgkinia cicadicola]
MWTPLWNFVEAWTAPSGGLHRWTVNGAVRVREVIIMPEASSPPKGLDCTNLSCWEVAIKSNQLVQTSQWANERGQIATAEEGIALERKTRSTLVMFCRQVPKAKTQELGSKT